MSKLTASVIICTRNRLKPLVTCLESLIRQTFPITQLIVVDSSEPSLETFTEFVNIFTQVQFPATQLIYLHTQPGLTLQRNQGIAQTKTDVVFFFDDDVVLYPRYIEYLMEIFQAHPEYGGGMGTITGIRSTQKRPDDILRRFFLLVQSGAEGRMQKSGLPTHSHGRSEFMEVEILSGCGAAYRSGVFKEFSFDEATTGYSYMEDVDFSYRVSRRYKLFYDPRVILEHHHSPLARDRVAKNRKMYLVNHHYFFFKNVYPDCPWCVIPYLWAVIGLFVQALLTRQWQALLGYSQGIFEVLKICLEGDHALSGR
jgi:GT2 family glycosyltransferase